jgi:DNA polymerase-3 subunit delta
MGSCFLFLGPEIGEKNAAVAKVRAGLGKPEEFSFYAGETPAQVIVSVLRNPSLFADSRLVFIKSAEVLKKKEDLEMLASYLEKPQDDTTLIIISDSVSLAKAIETPIPTANKRIFWELFEGRKIEWVRSFFQRAGYRISGDAVRAVLDLVENNTEALKQECSRLMLFLGKDKEVSAEEVERWLSHTREESAFTLFSCIAAGDLSKSLGVLRSLLSAKETAPGILAGLAWCWRRLLDYLAVGAGAADADYRKIGLGSAIIRRDYEQAARRYSRVSVETCLSLTAEYDILTRSYGAILESLLMDRYIYKILQTSPSPPSPTASAWPPVASK